MRRFTIAIVAFLALAPLVNAQQQPKIFGKTISAESVSPETGKVRCVTTEYEQYLREKDPSRATSAEFEQWIAPKIAVKKQQRLQKSGNTTAEVITIPVVVHVIHNGDSYGNNENITDEQVESQITVLNQDYRRMLGTPGYNSNPVGADVEIEFCLAQQDPDGNPTNGIDRHNLGQSSWGENAIENTLKPDTTWDSTKYFNIWVCNFGGDLNGVLGYAQFPNNSGLEGASNFNGNGDTDGVIIGYQYFGSEEIYEDGNYQFPYNQGRTATHEIGHALGLEHIWGTGFSNANCSSTDYCDDTPESNGPNSSCVQHFSCQSYDMIENYMDYTNDSCMNIFTQDQKDRIVTVMENATRRASLLTSDACQSVAGSKEFNLLNGINLYPNPAHNVLNIAVANGELPDSFTIYNSLGQTIASTPVTAQANLEVSTSAYSTGIYFIKIDKGTQSRTIKFIKN